MKGLSLDLTHNLLHSGDSPLVLVVMRINFEDKDYGNNRLVILLDSIVLDKCFLFLCNCADIRGSGF